MKERNKELGFPEVIMAYWSAANAGDIQEASQCFSHDAVVQDESQTHEEQGPSDHGLKRRPENTILWLKPSGGKSGRSVTTSPPGYRVLFRGEVASTSALTSRVATNRCEGRTLIDYTFPRIFP
jgi:hypothetical protein